VFHSRAEFLQPPSPNPIAPMVGPRSIILADGQRHRGDRALLMPAFHGTRMRDYGQAIADAAHVEIATWRPGSAIDARSTARTITLRVILGVVLGPQADFDTYLPVVRAFMDAYSGALMLVPAIRRPSAGIGPWDRFVAARERLNALLREDIRRARADLAAGTTRADVLSRLLPNASDDTVLDQVRTLLVAGHETTATSVVWALYHLHRDPDALAALRAELDQLPADADPVATARLPFLDAVCRETLRLHPPVPIVLRRIRDDAPPDAVRLRGVPMPPGSIMAVAVGLLHSDRAVWAHPRQFLPKRFLEHSYSAFEYAPFGGGHRRCVGSALAEYETRITVAAVIRRADLALTPRDLRGHPPMSVPRTIATSPRRVIPFQVNAVRAGADRTEM
jgi:cytochrome P450